jgi:hypothetical protein
VVKPSDGSQLSKVHGSAGIVFVKQPEAGKRGGGRSLEGCSLVNSSPKAMENESRFKPKKLKISWK